MSLTEAELRNAALLIAPEVRGARVRGIRDKRGAPDLLCMELRVPGTNHYLSFSTHPHASRISLLDDKPRAPASPSAFTSLLRARLGGGVLQSMSVADDDRIVECIFECHDDGDDQVFTLVAELMGRHSNLFLLDADRAVIGVLDQKKAKIRGAVPGTEYRPPDPPDRHVERQREGWEKHAHSIDELFPWLENHIAQKLANRRERQVRKQARARLKRCAKRLKRKCRHIQGDLKKAEKFDEYQRKADLLQSAYQTYEPGMTSVDVVDFHSPSQPTVTIETKPHVPLSEQIQGYYGKAKRLKSAIPDIESRLLETMEARDRVQRARDTITDDSSSEEIEQIVRELARDGILRQKQQPQTSGQNTGKGTKRSDTSASSHHTFRSSDGWLIFAGKNARGNDRLTTHIANGRDMWMHARDWSGAHVVIRQGQRGADIPQRTMREAALLAAHYSGGSNDTTVEIGYTRCKHVSKLPRTAPGAVYVSGLKTLLVAPEPDIVDRLRSNMRSPR